MKKPPDPIGKAAAEDAELFRATVGEVKPLAKQNRITPPTPRRKPLLHSSTPARNIPDILSDSALGETPNEYLSHGVSRMTLRKLRRGNWPIQDRLDLHGLRSEPARKLLQEFLFEAIYRELRCVLVIHGKGMNSPDGEAVLLKLARHWLTQHPSVLGYCEALPKEGGGGAVMVLLKTVKGET